jgi:hypothetical protein
MTQQSHSLWLVQKAQRESWLTITAVRLVMLQVLNDEVAPAGKRMGKRTNKTSASHGKLPGLDAAPHAAARLQVKNFLDIPS